MPDPKLRAIRAAIEELEAIAMLLRGAGEIRRHSGIVLAGPGIARVIEGTAARLLEALPPVEANTR